MTRPKCTVIFLDSRGEPAAGTQTYVYPTGAAPQADLRGPNLKPLYAAATGDTQAANPLLATDGGLVQFYLAGPRDVLLMTKVGGGYQWDVVPVPGTTRVYLREPAEKVTGRSLEPDLEHYIEFDLFDADIKAIKTAPFEVAPPPGANFVALVNQIVLTAQIVTPYTAVGDLIVEYRDGPGAIMTIPAADVANKTGMVHVVQSPDYVTAPFQPVPASAIQLRSAADWVGGDAASALQFRVYLKVFDPWMYGSPCS